MRLHEPVQPLERPRGGGIRQRVGVQRGAQLAHQRGGAHAVPDDVADRHADLASRQLEHVVPVPADLVARRQVARRRRHADDFREPARQQAALKQHRDAVLALERRVQARALDPRCGTRSGEVEHRQVPHREGTRLQGADVEHPDQLPLDDQRRPEQRADPLLAQDRVEDVRVIDVGDEDRDALVGDPAGEALADRDPHALLDLLLDPVRRARHELIGVLVEQQNRHGVHRQRVSDPIQELIQELIEPELRQRRVAQPLEPADLARRGEIGRRRGQHHLAGTWLRPFWPWACALGLHVIASFAARDRFTNQ